MLKVSGCNIANEINGQSCTYAIIGVVAISFIALSIINFHIAPFNGIGQIGSTSLLAGGCVLLLAPCIVSCLQKKVDDVTPLVSAHKTIKLKTPVLVNGIYVFEDEESAAKVMQIVISGQVLIYRIKEGGTIKAHARTETCEVPIVDDDELSLLNRLQKSYTTIPQDLVKEALNADIDFIPDLNVDANKIELYQSAMRGDEYGKAKDLEGIKYFDNDGLMTPERLQKIRVKYLSFNLLKIRYHNLTKSSRSLLTGDVFQFNIEEEVKRVIQAMTNDSILFCQINGGNTTAYYFVLRNQDPAKWDLVDVNDPEEVEKLKKYRSQKVTLGLVLKSMAANVDYLPEFEDRKADIDSAKKLLRHDESFPFLQNGMKKYMTPNGIVDAINTKTQLVPYALVKLRLEDESQNPQTGATVTAVS